MNEREDSISLRGTRSCQPLISVIVPIYNTELYLECCLESVANQTHTNLQVICVDDGSADGSLAICENFAKRDRRFSVLTQKNSGQSAARNMGIRCAQGEYVAFVDSDDYWDSDILEHLLSAMLEHDAQFAMCQVAHEDFSYNVDDVLHWKPIRCTGDEMVTNVLLSLNGFSASANHALFEASVVRDAFFLEGHIFEDVDYLVRVAPRVKHAVTLPDRMYHYRWREGNSSSRPLGSRVDDMRAVDLSLRELLALSDARHLAEVDQRFLSNMMSLAGEAITTDSPLFEEIRSEMMGRQFVASMQPKNMRVLWPALCHGRLVFTCARRLYSLYKKVKAVPSFFSYRS